MNKDQAVGALKRTEFLFLKRFCFCVYKCLAHTYVHPGV